MLIYLSNILISYLTFRCYNSKISNLKRERSELNDETSANTKIDTLNLTTAIRTKKGNLQHLSYKISIA